MVLKVRTDISPNIIPKISSCCTMKPDGLWKFDYVKYHSLEYPGIKFDMDMVIFWNIEFESVLNMSDLMVCNRCGIPDSKKNLDRGVEHSRMQCEEASYYFKIYKSLSESCREDPGKCLKELEEVRAKTKYRDDDIYGDVSYVLRNQPHQWCFEFDIPRYKGDNIAPEGWKHLYYKALEKLDEQDYEDDLIKEQDSDILARSITEDFGTIQLNTLNTNKE